MRQTNSAGTKFEIYTISQLIAFRISSPYIDESILDADPSFYSLLGVKPIDIIKTAELLIRDQYSDLFNPRFIVSQSSILGFYTAYPVNEIHQRELYSLSKWLAISLNMKDFIFRVRKLKGHKDSFDKEGYLYLSRICVRQSFRGLGLGSLMLDDLHNYAQEHGYLGTVLHVTSNNALAQKLYSKKGYKFNGISGDSSDQAHIRYLVMSREIN